MSINYFIGATGSLAWSATGNWSLGAIPVNGDDVVINAGNADINSGLAQSGVSLASLTIGLGFSGTLGTTAVSGGELAITATIQTINTAATRIKINNGSAQTTITVYATGTSADSGLEAYRVIGTNASNKLYVCGNASVGVATTNPAQVATFAEVDCAGNNAVLNAAAGTTLTTANCSQGTMTLFCAATTITSGPLGNVVTYGTGAFTTVNCGGTMAINNRGGSAAITTANVFANGRIDFSGNPAAITISTLNLYGNGTFVENAAAANHVTLTAFVLKNAGQLQAS